MATIITVIFAALYISMPIVKVLLLLYYKDITVHNIALHVWGTNVYNSEEQTLCQKLKSKLDSYNIIMPLARILLLLNSHAPDSPLYITWALQRGSQFISSCIVMDQMYECVNPWVIHMCPANNTIYAFAGNVMHMLAIYIGYIWLVNVCMTRL